MVISVEEKLLPPMRFIGMHRTFSYLSNETPLLWKSFMPRRMEVRSIEPDNLYHLQFLTDNKSLSEIKPDTLFTRWAAKRVDQTTAVPEGMEEVNITGGRYAVIRFKGSKEDVPAMMHEVFGKIFPERGWHSDIRPNFEVLGLAYRNDDPTSEEDFYFPIKV